MKLISVLFVGVVLSLCACSPKYGQQSCKASTECPTGEFCDLGCSANDGGSGSPRGRCAKACTTTDECTNLGLKKPFCAKSTCSVNTCEEDPS